MRFLQLDREGGFTVISRALIARRGLCQWLMACGFALMFFSGLVACRAEQPEVQIFPEATVVPTAVATLTHTPMVSAITMTPTTPTPTPFALPTRPTVRDFIVESNVSTTGLDTDILDQRIIAFERVLPISVTK